MRNRILSIVLTFVLGLGILAGIATALINPNFTPANLVDQAEYILLVKMKPATEKGEVATEVVRCVLGKDKAPKESIVFDINQATNEDYTKAFREAIGKKGDVQAIMVVGKDQDGESMGLLNMGGLWIDLAATDKATHWGMLAHNSHMQGTWAGGTDMLLKMIDLLVKYPETEVRVESGAEWGEALPITELKGAVAKVQAIDLAGKGDLVLYAASDQGDQVFVFDGDAQKFVNRTDAIKLTAKSKRSAWGNWNGDGRVDLASWDGEKLQVFYQNADGTFASGVVVEAAPKELCLGLDAIDAGTAAKAGILWSGPEGPVILKPTEKGFEANRLAVGKAALESTGKLGPCVVGDLDADGFSDVLQLAEKQSLLYRGEGKGRFASPQELVVALGPGGNAAFLGDWDMDGRLDVYCTSEDMSQLWHNREGLKFQDQLYISGEIAYISKPGAIGGRVCDVNADGLQDVLVYYGIDANNGPQIFFNRGFRSFGHGHHIDLSEQGLLGGKETEGQQAAVIADLNGDGAQDFVVVLKDGSTTFFPNTAGEWGVYGLRVALPTDAKVSGPICVTAWDETRCLGSQNLVAGSSEAFFGQVDPGAKLTIEWQTPGEKPTKKTFQIEDKLERHVLSL